MRVHVWWGVQLLVLACAPARTHAQEGVPGCSLRLINEAPDAVTLAAAGVQLDVQAFHGVGAYTPFPCTASNVSVRAGAHTATHTWANGSAAGLSTSHFTAFATYDGAVTRNLQLSLLADVEQSIPDAEGGGNIDACNLRVVSARYGLTSVGGVAAECYDCAHPILAVLGPGDATDYMFMDCAYDFSVQVSGNGTSSTRTFTLLEHGSYTVVVRNMEGAGPSDAQLSDLVTDVPGRWPFTPIFLAAAVLITLGVLHRLAAALLVWSRWRTPPPKQHVDVWNMFTVLGYDERIRHAMDKEATAHAAADSDVSAALLASVETSTSAGLASQATVVESARGSAPKPRVGGRIRSIDTLRGACLCIMIFVNYGAGNYQQLDHSKWNGLTLADLVFPIFVWTQGVSMAISFDSQRRKDAAPLHLALKTVSRALKLFALGLFLNGGSDLSEWRILGVLQYFAVAYLVVGLLESFAPGSRGTAAADDTVDSRGSLNAATGAHDANDLAQMTWLGALWHDLGRHAVQWAIMLSLGAVYIGLHFWLPVPSCPTGYAGPGGLANQGAYLNMGCTGGAHRYIDVSVFGIRHIFHDLDGSGNPISAATCAWPYLCDVHDPEGMLGWISAAWMTFLGLQAGRVFVVYGRLLKAATDAGERRAAHTAHIVRWLVWGTIIGTIGAGLAGFSKQAGLIPINKNLWSPSFVLVMAGLGFLGLAAFYTLVDVLHHWSGAPFCYIGMNSILVYAGHELLQDLCPFECHMGSDFASHMEAITSNIVGVSCWLLIARILYLKKFFVVI